MNKYCVLILAAGEGKRMKSANAKVSFPVCGKPLVKWVIDAAKGAGVDEAAVVVGHCAEQVKEIVKNDAATVLQKEQLGTGHAVMQARDEIASSDHVMVLTGDTPLITSETLRSVLDEHLRNGNSATVITAVLDDPTGYGRIVRDASGNVLKIVEHKDCDAHELEICEINSGMFCFKTADLLGALDHIKNDNNQNEYYLTDAVEILNRQGKKVGASIARDNTEIRGINDRVQLAEAEAIMRRRINSSIARGGVTFVDIDCAYIEDIVTIGRDSVIYPNVIISGNSRIGENVIIGANSIIENGVVGDGERIEPFSHIK